MKNYLSLAPFLAKPKVREPLFLYLMVFKNVTSVVLVKEQNNVQHPVYCVSKSF